MKPVFALTELWMWDSMVFYCKYKMAAWYMEHTQRTNAHPHDGLSLCFRSPQTGYQIIRPQLRIPSFLISVFHFQATLVCPQNNRNFHLATSENASSVLRLAFSHILAFLKLSCILAVIINGNLALGEVIRGCPHAAWRRQCLQFCDLCWIGCTGSTMLG